MSKSTYESVFNELEDSLAGSGQIAQGLPATDMWLKNLLAKFRDTQDLLKQARFAVGRDRKIVSAEDHRGLPNGSVRCEYSGRGEQLECRIFTLVTRPGTLGKWASRRDTNSSGVGSWRWSSTFQALVRDIDSVGFNEILNLRISRAISPAWGLAIKPRRISDSCTRICLA